MAKTNDFVATFATEFLAVARASKACDNAARKAVTVGKHTVNQTFEVTGEYEVLPDEDYIPTAELPVKLLLAVFLKRSGAIGSANAKLLRDIVREATEANADETISDALYEALPELDRIVAEYMQPVCDDMPKKTRAGKVLSKDLRIRVVAE